MGCNCGKPKPGPNGNQKPPAVTPSARALVASAGGAAGLAGNFTHVAPNGSRTSFGDILGARAEVARQGGRVEPV